jgi:hypothetical protein
VKSENSQGDIMIWGAQGVKIKGGVNLSNFTVITLKVPRVEWYQGLKNTPRNKLFSNMWEGRDPHISMSLVGHFLGVTSGWAGVTITKFSEGPRSCYSIIKPGVL